MMRLLTKSRNGANSVIRTIKKKKNLACAALKLKCGDKNIRKIEAVHCNVVFRSDYKGDFDDETAEEIKSWYTKKKEMNRLKEVDEETVEKNREIVQI